MVRGHPSPCSLPLLTPSLSRSRRLLNEVVIGRLGLRANGFPGPAVALAGLRPGRTGALVCPDADVRCVRCGVSSHRHCPVPPKKVNGRDLSEAFSFELTAIKRYKAILFFYSLYCEQGLRLVDTRRSLRFSVSLYILNTNFNPKPPTPLT